MNKPRKFYKHGGKELDINELCLVFKHTTGNHISYDALAHRLKVHGSFEGALGYSYQTKHSKQHLCPDGKYRTHLEIAHKKDLPYSTWIWQKNKYGFREAFNMPKRAIKKTEQLPEESVKGRPVFDNIPQPTALELSLY